VHTYAPHVHGRDAWISQRERSKKVNCSHEAFSPSSYDTAESEFGTRAWNYRTIMETEDADSNQNAANNRLRRYGGRAAGGARHIVGNSRDCCLNIVLRTRLYECSRIVS
jgi:hypothetical protein